MPQIRKIEDAILLERLDQTFRNVGFEGASLAAIADSTGLKKSSLYHRFPNGKEQMAIEVLSTIVKALEGQLLPVLDSNAAPSAKMEHFVGTMDRLYCGGRASCLLNMLAPPRGDTTERGNAINAIFETLRHALCSIAIQAGAKQDEADLRAEQVLVEVQGALVVARGSNDPKVFQRTLGRLSNIILPA